MKTSTIGWHITKAEKLRYVNAEHTKINCEVDFSHVEDGPYEFTANRDDMEKHGREIFETLNSGEYGPIADYASPIPTKEELISAARRKRMITLIDELNAGTMKEIESGKITDFVTLDAFFNVEKKNGA